MKEFLVLTVLLIQAQDSNNFKTREHATVSLEYLAYIYDIRPALNKVITNNKNSLELRRRCDRVDNFVTQLYLNDMKYRPLSNMPKRTAYCIPSKTTTIYGDYSLAMCAAMGFNCYDGKIIKSIEIPQTLDEFIMSKYNDNISDKDILQELENRINGKPTKKSERSSIATPTLTWERRFRNIYSDARTVYSNLLSSWTRPLSAK